jgi:hypothetical protein
MSLLIILSIFFYIIPLFVCLATLAKCMNHEEYRQTHSCPSQLSTASYAMWIAASIIPLVNLFLFIFILFKK